MLSLYLYSLFLPLLSPLLYSNFRLLKYSVSVSKKKKKRGTNLNHNKREKRRFKGKKSNLNQLKFCKGLHRERER